MIGLLKGAVVHRARVTDLRRRVRLELRAKGQILLAVPHLRHAPFLHAPEVVAVRRRDHAAGHRVPLIADVWAVPWPVTAIAARGPRRMRPHFRTWEPQIDA